MAKTYRSGFEAKLVPILEALGGQYEVATFEYMPTKPKRYTPDVTFGNMHLELKGYFTGQDRTKLLAVRESNPGIDLRLVFQTPNNRLSKSSRTTYAQWADKHGFLWADAKDGDRMYAWIKEANNGGSSAASVGSRN